MKKPRSRLPLIPFVLLLAGLAAIATARVAATEKKPADASAATDKFQLTWSRAPSPELQFATEKLQAAEKRFHNGQASKEELLGIRQHIEELERRVSYRLTLVSRGGSLREFIAATAGSDEVSFTLINAGEPADLETPIPPFSLRNAHWGTIIEVLANFLGPRDLQLKIAGSDRPDPAESKSIVCVLRRVGPGPEAARARPAAFDSFPLNDCLADQSIDDIISAIREAWELDPAHDKAALRLKFHPATAILLVSGPPEATMIAGKVISQLTRTGDKSFRATNRTPASPAPAPKR